MPNPRKEESIAPYGFEVHKVQLLEQTRRSVDTTGRWPGLTAIDGAIFEQFVANNKSVIDEIHTDVPCGICASPPEWLRTDQGKRQLESMYPLRIDAVVRAGGVWHIVEVKPDAGYRSLGQVLTYKFWAKHTNPMLVDAVPCIVTDRVQEVITPVFDLYGVTVFEVTL